MPDKTSIVPRNVGMYPSHWAIVDQYAKDQGFSISLALRKIVDEWQALSRGELVLRRLTDEQFAERYIDPPRVLETA